MSTTDTLTCSNRTKMHLLNKFWEKSQSWVKFRHNWLLDQMGPSFRDTQSETLSKQLLINFIKRRKLKIFSKWLLSFTISLMNFMSRVLLKHFQNSQILTNLKIKSNIGFQIDGLRNSTNMMLLILIFITKKLELSKKGAKLIKLKRFNRGRRLKKLYRIRFSVITQLSWKMMTSRRVRLRSIQISYPRLRRRVLCLKTGTMLCQQMHPSKELMSFLLRNP